MCRLFGLSAGHTRVRATFWLLEAPSSLSILSQTNPDGTGLASFDAQGHPVVEKSPLAAHRDEDFAVQARTRDSAVFLAHVRRTSGTSVNDRNTHPFVMDDRAFAHNGVVAGLDLLQRHLGPDLARVAGDTDSERMFALITREIAAAGGDVQAGIAAALRWVAANLPVYAANFLLASATDLWALRYPDNNELWVLDRRHPVADQPAPDLPTQLTPSNSTDVISQISPAAEPMAWAGAPTEVLTGQATVVSVAASAQVPSVVIASQPMDADPRWRLIDSGVLVHVGPDLSVSQTLLLPGPPRYPLALSTLGHTAAASQEQ